MQGDYVSLYLNSAFAQNDLVPVLSLMFLFFGRILPIIALVPFFGGKVLPRPVKMAFAFSLFTIFLPQLMTVTQTPLEFNLTLVLLLAKEFLIGLVVGFFLNFPFVAVQSVGILIDHQRGASSLMVNDPTIQGQSSPLGTLFNYLLIYLFFLMDGQFLVLDMVSESYTLLPPDRLLNEVVFSDPSKLISPVTHFLGSLMILTAQLAAPALIMILMTDFFLGIANRMAPQVQITFLGMPLKSLLALVIVYFGWTLFWQEVVQQSYKTIGFVGQIIKNFAS